jgi:O-antigen/teichoic acid export membrane protein
VLSTHEILARSGWFAVLPVQTGLSTVPVLSTVDDVSKVSGGRLSVPPIALLGAGMALVGAAGYAFVAIAGHTLSTSETAAASSFYLLVNILGPGLFLAVEQETSRRTSHALAVGERLLPVVRKTGMHAVGLLLVVIVVLCAAAPALIDRSLSGDAGLFLALVLATVFAAAVYLVRGLLGGHQRFGGYAATLAGEGLGRLLPVLAVAATGHGTATGYGMLFALGTCASALTGLPWLVRRPRSGPACQTAEATTKPVVGTGLALGLLAASTLLSHMVANLAPIVVTARLATDTATASAFAAAFILIRVPLFLISPVQALLMPALTAAIARRDYPALRSRLRSILSLVAALGVLGILGSVVLGPWAVQALFGARVSVSGSLLGLLAVGTAILMAAQVLQPALLAFGSHRTLAAAWGVGTAVMGALLALPGDPIWAAMFAQLAGPTVLVLGMAGVVLRQLRLVRVPVYPRGGVHQS